MVKSQIDVDGSTSLIDLCHAERHPDTFLTEALFECLIVKPLLNALANVRDETPLTGKLKRFSKRVMLEGKIRSKLVE